MTDIINNMIVRNKCLGLLFGALVCAAPFAVIAESSAASAASASASAASASAASASSASSASSAMQLSASQKKTIKAFVSRFDTIAFGSEYDKKFANTIIYIMARSSSDLSAIFKNKTQPQISAICKQLHQSLAPVNQTTDYHG